MSRTRVVVTGAGLITPLGQNVEKVWDGLRRGQSGIRTLTAFDTTAYDVHFGGQAWDYSPEGIVDERDLKRLDRFAQFAVVASEQALRDSGIDRTRERPDRVGVILGSGIGGLETLEEQHRKLFEKGPSRVSPFFIPRLMMNAGAGQVALHFGFTGPNFAVASACASANHALGIALRSLRNGEADVILAGGSEAAVTPCGVAGFSALRALSTRNDSPQTASRPFDKNRDGFVLSEGAGIAVLETLDHARKRGARIYAEFLGFGMTCDGHHITAPEPTGGTAARAITQALEDAQVRPGQVSYVNAHGTSTQLNDATETKAIQLALGDHARRVPISSTKSMLGHSLGAAAGIEFVVSCLTVRDNVVHPTLNLATPDPECPLDYVPKTARELPVQVAISNSLGFGGHNTSVVVGKFRE